MNNRFKSAMDSRKESVRFIIGEISHVCQNLKPRAPGSEGEREAAQYMAELLREKCGCCHVTVESFREHPSAFYSYFYFSMTFDTLCAVCSFLSPWLSILFGCAALAIFLFQFVLYQQVIDPLFPVKTGTNVTAIRPSTGEVKRRVFLNGHIDAAWEFPVNYHFGGIAFEIPGVMALIGVLYYIGIAIASLCGAGTWTQTAFTWGLLFVPFFVAVAFTYNPRFIVPGANDNLTGCFIGIAILKAMEEEGIELAQTEVGVILTGSEEAGLRGSKAWCQQHRDDFRDVPAYVLCLDTIHNPQELMVNERDLNGTVACDTQLADLYLQAAKEVGVPCKKGMIPLMGGATDSAAFAQGGFRSVGITGLSHKLERYYHTRLDYPGNLDPEGIENCMIATMRTLEMIEEGALDS